MTTEHSNNCQFCGNPLNFKRATKKFCSDKCKLDAFNEKQKNKDISNQIIDTNLDDIYTYSPEINLNLPAIIPTENLISNTHVEYTDVNKNNNPELVNNSNSVSNPVNPYQNRYSKISEYIMSNIFKYVDDVNIIKEKLKLKSSSESEDKWLSDRILSLSDAMLKLLRQPEQPIENWIKLFNFLYNLNISDTFKKHTDFVFHNFCLHLQQFILRNIMPYAKTQQTIKIRLTLKQLAELITVRHFLASFSKTENISFFKF